MDQQSILDELLALLQTGDVAIRTEPLGGSGGGLCTVKGQKIFFIDSQASDTEVAALCAEAVAKIIDIEKIFIRPEVRQFIETCSSERRI